MLRNWRDEIPSVPGSFFDDSDSSTQEVSDKALLLLMTGCILTGLIPGVLIGLETAQPPSTLIESARDTGYHLGFEAGIGSFPDGEPRVLFRQDDLFNRSIAFTYPNQNISYECTFSRRTTENGGGEWAIDRQAFKYNGTVDCTAVEKDLIPEYSGADISDTLLRNEVHPANATR